jgi:hypothetical protein
MSLRYSPIPIVMKYILRGKIHSIFHNRIFAFDEHANESIMLLLYIYMILNLIRNGNAFLLKVSNLPLQRPLHWQTTIVKMSTTTILSSSDITALSWSDLQNMVGETSVGTALNNESKLRLEGKGSAHVQNKLRTFDSNDEPVITLFRDHAGWSVIHT